MKHSAAHSLLNLRALLAAALLAFVGLAFAYGIKCPIDNASAYTTGKTKVDPATGKLLQEAKCPNGHVFWTVN